MRLGLFMMPLHPPTRDYHEMYDDLRTEGDSRAALLDFFQSAYEAGARRAGWDRAALEPAVPA